MEKRNVTLKWSSLGMMRIYHGAITTKRSEPFITKEHLSVMLNLFVLTTKDISRIPYLPIIIITNYDCLAETTFFTHCSFNYRNDQLIKDTHPCHRLFSEFIVTDPNALVYVPRHDSPDSSQTFYDYPDTAETVFQRIFNNPYPTKRYIWGCGKIVTVGKHLILKRPKRFYENALEFIMSPHNNEEPSQHVYRTRGIYIERFFLLFFK